ncbi:MAG: hypothetical protein AB8B97_22755 [Granulosicoccus sp.]
MSRVQSVEALGNDVGTPTTWVHSVGRDLPSIIAALEDGRASVSANPYAPRADLTAQVDGQPMRMGANHALPAQPVTITLQLTQALPAPYRVRIISNRAEHVTL